MTVVQRHNTLRLRFAVWTAGLVLTALVLFGALVYFNMSRGLAASVDDSLEVSTAQAIAAVVDNDRLSLTNGLPASAAITTLNERGLSIRVLSLNGERIAGVGLYSDLPIL